MTSIVVNLPNILFCFGLALIPLVPLDAQSDQCLARSITVTVVADDGKPVENLRAADFRASLRGNTVKIVHADFNKNPRRVVVMLDVSDSVTRPTGVWPSVLATARDFVRIVPPYVSVAVMISRAVRASSQILMKAGR